MMLRCAVPRLHVPRNLPSSASEPLDDSGSPKTSIRVSGGLVAAVARECSLHQSPRNSRANPISPYESVSLLGAAAYFAHRCKLDRQTGWEDRARRGRIALANGPPSVRSFGGGHRKSDPIRCRTETTFCELRVCSRKCCDFATIHGDFLWKVSQSRQVDGRVAWTGLISRSRTESCVARPFAT